MIHFPQEVLDPKVPSIPRVTANLGHMREGGTIGIEHNKPILRPPGALGEQDFRMIVRWRQ